MTNPEPAAQKGKPVPEQLCGGMIYTDEVTNGPRCVLPKGHKGFCQEYPMTSQPEPTADLLPEASLFSRPLAQEMQTMTQESAAEGRECREHGNGPYSHSCIACWRDIQADLAQARRERDEALEAVSVVLQKDLLIDALKAELAALQEQLAQALVAKTVAGATNESKTEAH